MRDWEPRLRLPSAFCITTCAKTMSCIPETKPSLWPRRVSSACLGARQWVYGVLAVGRWLAVGHAGSEPPPSTAPPPLPGGRV